MSDNPTVLRLLKDASDAHKSKQNAKAEAYKRRAKSKSNFYIQARINAKLVIALKKALLMSAVTDDDGEALMAWSDEMIQQIVDSIEDTGPVNKK